MKTKIVLFVAVLLSVTAFSQKKWTLKECVDYALENNITIKQNKLTASLAEKDVAIAKGNFLPNLSASSTSRTTLGLSTGGDNTRSSADRYSLSLNLNGGGTIFNGFRNLNSYKQAQLGVESSK
ncbi:MAG: TolC family protein, partial [Polaribacter sp.]